MMVLFVAMLISGVVCIAVPVHAQSLVPFDRVSGAIYDNDDHRDVYTDEYLLALSHLGEIDLKGMITTYSPNAREYNLFVKGRREIVEKARQSGFKNLPEVDAGAEKPLVRPASNRIEDTEPQDLEASRFVVAQALRATADAPLVYVSGNQLTTLANAYLLDPSIADKVVVSALIGIRRRDYHVGLDPWAYAIVLSHFRVLAVPVGPSTDRGMVYMKAPAVPKVRIASELPLDMPIFRWMHEKKHPTNWLPGEHDFDGHVAIAMMEPDYITRVQRWKSTGLDDRGNPVLEEDDEGPIYEALDADQGIATEEFWRVMDAVVRLRE